MIKHTKSKMWLKLRVLCERLFLKVFATYVKVQEMLVVKDLPANARDLRPGFYPWVGNIPWRRTWQPTPVFLPGEFHEQRSLADYSPWDHKKSDMT